ncbi:MAG TPA: methylated-DNA--[protein]-cysteine S-methyltransferase [Thermoleophilia bacterium]|nr:methylated-DNA--[protein]-cysteine S-methyltransferase [Thermoleophilia bacterium]
MNATTTNEQRGTSKRIVGVDGLVVPSPIGDLTLYVAGGALTAVHFGAAPNGEGAAPGTSTAAAEASTDAPIEPVLQAAAEQLAAYFAGELREFTLPLRPAGTPFQLAVWETLRHIPYGETVSYGELATRLGRSGAARAVGRANALNPLPVVVPCHRVIGADGTLTGYAGGLSMKRTLLALEAGTLRDRRSCRVPPARV